MYSTTKVWFIAWGDTVLLKRKWLIVSQHKIVRLENWDEVITSFLSGTVTCFWELKGGCVWIGVLLEMGCLHVGRVLNVIQCLNGKQQILQLVSTVTMHYFEHVVGTFYLVQCILLKLVLFFQITCYQITVSILLLFINSTFLMKR